MIKLRMMGTPEELQRFRRILLRMEEEGKITVQSLSAMYANKDTEIFFRMYAEIKTARKGKNDEREEIV